MEILACTPSSRHSPPNSFLLKKWFDEIAFFFGIFVTIHRFLLFYFILFFPMIYQTLSFERTLIYYFILDFDRICYLVLKINCFSY